MADNPSTRIQPCGRLAVELAGRDLTPKLPGGQARVLFTYLTVSRALPSRREELIEALWPWQAPAGADTALSALLSRLRSVLGGEVLCGRGEIHLELPRYAWIDLEAAEEAIHHAEAAVAQEDWARGWGPSLVALFTARRGFLPGEDLTWAEDYRRRLEEIRVAALECYAAVALGVGGSELAPGERVARELVALAPYRERGHALLMEILTARGNSAEALRIYEQLRQRLRDELGAIPAPELRELQERLLRRRAARRDTPPVSPQERERPKREQTRAASARAADLAAAESLPPRANFCRHFHYPEAVARAPVGDVVECDDR